MALTKVTSNVIADDAITSAMIAPGAIDGTHITGITTTDIAEGTNQYYTDGKVGTYLNVNGYDTATNIISAITDTAPATLDTLNELAAALGDDPNFATTTATAIGLKAPIASPSFTGAATFSGTVTADGLTVGDNQWIYAGNGADLKIGHDGIDNIIRAQGSPLYIDANGTTFRGYSPYTKHMDIASNGDISFYEDTGTTPKFFWDASAESLSIGTTGSTDDRRLQISAFSPSSSTTQYGIVANPTYPVAVTSAVYNIYTGPNLTSGTTLPNLYNLFLEGNGISGSTVTNSYGLYQAGANDKNYFAGNVGIGVTNPGQTLEIHNSDASDYTDFALRGTGHKYVIGVGNASVATVNDKWYLYDNDNSAFRMVVDTSGNVGIGTTDPTGKLHVSGGRAGVISTASSWGQFRVGNTYDGEAGIAYVTGATESDFLGDGDPTCAYKVITGINPYGAGNRNFGIGNDTIANYHTIWTEGGHQLPRVDNTYDLGATNYGFRNVHLSSNLYVGGHIIGDDDTSYMRMNAGPGGGGAIYLNGSTRTNYENHIQYLADVHNFGDVDGNPINTLQVVSDSELVTINGNLNVTKPIQTTTDTGTRMYTGLATGSHYNEVGYLILDTNIPGHASSGNANMFSISIEGFFYSQTNGGIVDLNIGCYAGESNYYNASFSGSNIPDAWVTNMWVSTNSSGKVAFIFGTTGAAQDIEVACTKFIQGFTNVNTAYANGWDFKVQTDLTGYSQLTVVRPKFTKKPSFSAGSSGFSVSANGWQIISDSMSQVTDGPTDNYNPTNGRFTPQFPGWYQFNFGGWATYNSSTGQERYAVAFAKNGSLTYISGGNYSAADSPLTGAGQRVYLNGSTDYVVLYAYSSVATQWGGSSHWVWWDGYWTGS